MIQHDFPRLRETYTEFTLPNGLRVRVLHKPEFHKLYAFLGVNYGSVDTVYRLDGETRTTPDGVAHYLEHKMFDLPRGNAMEGFAALGGSPNAFTGYGVTAYYVQTTQAYEENLALLLEMVLTPCFTQESVEKERGIIAQEINMYADSPDSRLYELLNELLYPGNPLAVPIAGSVESIQDITAQTLRDCYDAFYRPENMLLVVEGNLSPERVREVAEPLCQVPMGAPAASRFQELPTPPQPGRVLEVQMDVSMPTFALAYPLPDAPFGDGKGEAAGDLAAELLAGESSPLYRRLYEGGLIDASFSPGYEGLRRKGSLVFSGDSRDPKAVAEAIRAEAVRLRREGIHPADLGRVKKSFLGRRIRDLDSFSGTCYRICGSDFDGVEYLDFPALFDSVTPEDVLEQLSYIDRDREALVIINQKEEASCT